MFGFLLALLPTRRVATAVAAAPPVFALPLLWCAECGDEVGDDVCYSVGGRVVFCAPTCRGEWERYFDGIDY